MPLALGVGALALAAHGAAAAPGATAAGRKSEDATAATRLPASAAALLALLVAVSGARAQGPRRPTLHRP